MSKKSQILSPVLCIALATVFGATSCSNDSTVIDTEEPGMEQLGTGEGGGSEKPGTGEGGGSEKPGTGEGGGSEQPGTGEGGGSEHPGTGEGGGNEQLGTGEGGGSEHPGTGEGGGSEQPGTGEGGGNTQPKTCPSGSAKAEPGVCGCQFEDKDIDGDGKIDCPVKVIPDDILPDLPDIEGTCAEWEYPKHPKVEFPDLPEYGYETTIDLKKYNISNVYDVSKAEETTNGLSKAIEDAKNAGFTRIVIPDGHYPILGTHKDIQPGIRLQDGIALIMSDKVTLQMVPAKAYDCNIINLRKRANVYIEGGVLIGDKYDHTLSKEGTTDEECNALTSYYSNHITLNKMKIKQSHGDGLLIYDYKPSKQPQVSAHFIIANSEFDDNFRQGISVVGVDGLRITNNEIHHTKGTAPQFGIDFEGAGAVNKNVIVDHNYFHDNVGGDVIIDSYDSFIEYNRFSSGDMEKYIDNPFIIRKNCSYVAYRNKFEKFTKSTGCGYAVCCSYANGFDINSEQDYPSFFVENEINKTRLMLTRRVKVCVKNNVIHDGHLSASTIRMLRLIDNHVDHGPDNTISGYYSFQNVYGTASGNIRCKLDDCQEEPRLNGAMTEDASFSLNTQFF